MNISFIVNYWYLWLIGLIISPLLAFLPQLNNFRKMSKHVDEAYPPDFFKPGIFIFTIFFGVLTLIFFILFLASLVISVTVSIA
ncbi:MAG: hypothetical protein KGY75_09710 [Candidatus Cloacimonetes bacterium]|nr:hypothetical protein [Candidatus Cloacimonadota bacterium]